MKFSVRFTGLLVGLALVFAGCESSSDQSSDEGAGVDTTAAVEHPVSTEESNAADTTAVFQVEYEKWLAAAIASGEFCSDEMCWEEREKFEKDMDYEMQCMIGLPAKPEYLVGDLNGDGVMDAVAEADWSQCDGGNALHTAESWLVFLSQPDGSFITIEDPGAFGSMDIGGIYEIKDGVMYAQGLAYHEDDPRCCPSISWDVEYKVVDGDPSTSSALRARVIESAITEQVREEME